MTIQEMKLELAKVAIEHGLPLFDTMQFYNWIVEEEEEAPYFQEKKFDNMSIFELMRPSRSRYRVRVTNVCAEYDIRTVGDLMKYGVQNIRKCRNMGMQSYEELIRCLEQIGFKV